MNQESKSMFLKTNPFFPVVVSKSFNEVGEFVDPTKVILTLYRTIFKNHLFSEMTEITEYTCLHVFPFQEEIVFAWCCHTLMPWKRPFQSFLPCFWFLRIWYFFKRSSSFLISIFLLNAYGAEFFHHEC